MVETKASFPHTDTVIFGNVAWSVARLLHLLPASIYLDTTRKTSKVTIYFNNGVSCVCVLFLFSCFLG